MWIRGSVSGGGIAASFTQYTESRVWLENVTFEENHSDTGGAIDAVYNVHTGDKGIPRLKFSGIPVDPSLTFFNTTFQRNNSTDGGSVHFDGIQALFQGVNMQENVASESGGGLYIIGGSVVRIINGSFSSNNARHGGGLMIDQQSMLHCTSCLIEGNTAEENGGGVCISAQRYDAQPIAFQCDACDFINNTAAMGGTSYIHCVIFATEVDFVA